MFSTLMVLLGVISANPGTPNSCDFGTPHPDAPAELQQFDFLAGNHRVEVRRWQGEAFSTGYLEAAWNGRWGLEGRAMIDEWFGVTFAEDIPPNLGVNVRIYDAENERWNMTWQQTAGGADNRLLGAAMGEDGVLRMWQVHPEPETERFIYFEIIDDTHWARVDGTVEEDGTEVPSLRIDAFKVPCEG